MTVEVDWTRLTGPDIRAVAARGNALAVLPVGSLEQHGPHLPVITDTRTAWEISIRAARLAAPAMPVLVLPGMWTGMSEHHLPFGGTISLSFAEFRGVLAGVARSLRAIGFGRLLIVNGHGGNVDPLAVAVYAPAIQIDAGLLLLVSGLAAVLLPHSALAHARSDIAAVRKFYILGTLASALLLTICAIAVWLMSAPLFRFWLHDSLPATRAILPLVLIHTVVGGSSAVGRSVLLAVGKVKPFTIAVLVAGATNVLCSFVFVRYFGLGLRGIVMGTIVAVVARCAIWTPWFVLRTLRAAA